MKRQALSLALLFAFHISTSAASMKEMDHGPFVSWTIRGEGDSVTYKGLAIQLPGADAAAVCFDTDLLRYSAAWTGDFLQWYPERDGLERNPRIAGTIHHRNGANPGWSPTDSLADPRALAYGPLPKQYAHYRGLYRLGEQIVLSYSVGERHVYETPHHETLDGEGYFVRSIQLSPGPHATLVRIARVGGQDARLSSQDTSKGHGVLRVHSETMNRLVGFDGLPASAKWQIEDDHLTLQLPASNRPLHFAILIGGEPRGPIRTHQGRVAEQLATTFDPQPVGHQRFSETQLWADTLMTPIRTGPNRNALAVDTLTVPHNNPWKSWIRFGGLDFLSDDQAILGSVSGDVWLVSGLGAGSKQLTWKRFATGLYQPLGVKIVDGQIYVLGRDQITRLHDLNQDGEADYYENFNNDSMVAENFHSFTLNLETDSEGNFFYAQGSPWPPNVKTPHQGILFKVSPDGKHFESYADGLRGPNGMAIGPGDMITYSDNEGHWLPTCSLQLIRKGGFHGMKPTAHLHEGIPETYEPPICWIPHAIDNSPGDQIWIDSEAWGPLNGKMFLTSYGKSSLSLVLTQDVNGQVQGGTVKLPIRFRSGLIRGRQSTFDDHLYVCGLSVWQTTGVQPGGFYRVRYTGRPLNAPVDLAVESKKIVITFSDALDREEATDPEAYNIEQWNYRWIERYGSPHYSVKNPDEEGHDTVAISSIALSQDGKTVTLHIPDLVPVMQMKIAFNLRSAEGARVRHEIYNTIHAIP